MWGRGQSIKTLQVHAKSRMEPHQQGWIIARTEGLKLPDTLRREESFNVFNYLSLVRCGPVGRQQILNIPSRRSQRLYEYINSSSLKMHCPMQTRHRHGNPAFEPLVALSTSTSTSTSMPEQWPQ